MQERFAAALAEGMDVYDLKGDKVGTVGKIYRPAATTAAPGSFAAPPSGADQYLKVDTGFLGLGKDLYIPTSAVSDISGERVTLTVDKDRLDEMGWDRRPEWAPED
jgi:hypothetical protein